MAERSVCVLLAAVDNASAELLPIESGKTIYTWCLIIFSLEIKPFYR
ncbi:MAG: hypothetical protein GX900_00940 [Clostridiaceae bacterium]|nr:hypothetical protein [Clostridiaceae bacterium]